MTLTFNRGRLLPAGFLSLALVSSMGLLAGCGVAFHALDSGNATTGTSSTDDKKGNSGKVNADLQRLIRETDALEDQLRAHDMSFSAAHHAGTYTVAYELPAAVSLGSSDAFGKEVSGSDPLSADAAIEMLQIATLLNDYQNKSAEMIKKATQVARSSPEQFSATVNAATNNNSDYFKEACSKRLGAIDYINFLSYRGRLDSAFRDEKALRDEGVVVSDYGSVKLTPTLAGDGDLSEDLLRSAQSHIRKLDGLVSGYGVEKLKGGAENSIINQDIQNRGVSSRSSNAKKLASFLRVRTDEATLRMTKIVSELREQGLVLNPDAREYGYNYGSSSDSLFRWDDKKIQLGTTFFDDKVQTMMRNWRAKLGELAMLGEVHSDVLDFKDIEFNNGFQESLRKSLKAAEQAKGVLDFKLAQSSVVESENRLRDLKVTFTYDTYYRKVHTSYPQVKKGSSEAQIIVLWLELLSKELVTLEKVKVDNLSLGRDVSLIGTQRELVDELITQLK